MSVSSYLGSRLFSICVTLEGSLGNSWTVLFSLSSGWMDNLEVFASGITESRGDSTIAFLRFCKLMEPVEHPASHNFLDHSRMLA
jgi:hypothetical protein